MKLEQPQKELSHNVTENQKTEHKLWFHLAAILLISLPVFFFLLGGWSFTDPDEGRYGSIPWQMLVRGDFITPTQNGVKFFDKPPLLYWAMAASYSVFGLQEWAARLIPALSALAALFAVYALGRRMFSARAGLLAALILATSLLWPIMARIVITDMLVSSLLFVALTFWWLAHSETESRRQTLYFLAFWAALALAMLAKGPVVIVLVGGGVFLYALWCKQLKSLSQMRWIWGVPLFALIAAPWFVLVAQRNPEFNHYFWYDQHVARFLGRTTGNDHVEWTGYYLQFFPLIFFPWSFFAPAAILAGWKKLRSEKVTSSTRSMPQWTFKQRAAIYLLCHIAFTTLFYSASSGKLLTYIVPVVPLFALLLAAYFDWILTKNIEWNKALSIGATLLAAVLAIAGVSVMLFATPKLRGYGVDESVAIVVGLLFMFWGATTLLSSWRFRLRGLIASTACGFMVIFASLLIALSTASPRFLTASVVEAVRPGLTPQAEVVSLGYIRSVPFYTRKRVKVFGPPDELKLGVTQLPPDERREWFHEGENRIAELRETMNVSHAVYAFMRVRKKHREDVDDTLRKVGNGAAVIARNERYLVFGNRAALRATPPQRQTVRE